MSWNLHFPRAEFPSDTSTISIALETRLGCEITDTRTAASSSVSNSLLSLEIVPSEAGLPLNIDLLSCADAYVRESDLIVSYPQHYPWPFGFQADFRCRTDLLGGVHAMELWFSVSTTMLECHPRLHLIPETRFQRSSLPEIAIALHGRAAMIVHPLDLADCEPIPSLEFEGVGHWDVFGSFMEKGVIRRARFLVAWSDTPQPADTWKQLRDWFAQSPLPLTA